jgi:altronate hydrolase
MKQNVVAIKPTDNVAVAITSIKAGERIVSGTAGGLEARQDIPKGHKVALRRICEGGEILKYGQVIGHAGGEIQPGDHVHTHNLRYRES